VAFFVSAAFACSYGSYHFVVAAPQREEPKSIDHNGKNGYKWDDEAYSIFASEYGIWEVSRTTAIKVFFQDERRTWPLLIGGILMKWGLSEIRLSLVMVCFALVHLPGCGKSSMPAEVKHDLGRVVVSPMKGQWQDLSPQEFDEIYIPANGWGTPDNFYPEDSAATQRMNFLLSTIHETLKKKYPEQLAEVPVPRSRIYMDPEADARVTMVPVCYNIQVEFQRHKGTPSPTGVLDVVTMDVNGNFSKEKGTDECLSKTLSLQEAYHYFGGLNREIRRSAAESGHNGALCQIGLRYDKRGLTVRPNSLCKRDSAAAGAKGAKSLRIWKTQPYIILYSGLITFLDAEIKIVTTLAHELGHYYRGHVASFRGDYGYFYKVNKEGNSHHKPRRDPSLAARGTEILAAAQLVQSPLHREPGQKYPSELFYPIWAVASRACPDAAECSAPCLDLVTALHDDAFYQSFGSWPYEKTTDAIRASYAQYEKHLAACSPELKISSAPSHGNLLSLDDLKAAFDAEGFSAQARMMGYEDLSVFEGRTLSEVIDELARSLQQAQARAHEVIDKAMADHIGYYTTEQEADDLQMEIVALLGLDPRQLVMWDIDFYRDGRPTWDKYQGFDMDRCKQLLLGDWKENGEVVLPSVANYYDTHHSPCFRIFNTYREIAAHDLKPSPEAPQIKFLIDDEWRELQKSVSGDETSAPEEGAKNSRK
jgi:hypothetical protein